MGLEALVRQLLSAQSETRNLDYKDSLSFSGGKAEKCGIVKDIIAMANIRDGGFILMGVQQDGGRFVPCGVTKAQADSFDPTRIGDFCRNYCSVLPVVTTHVVTVDGIDLLLLKIAEFADEPIVCTKDMNKSGSTSEFVLRAGSIYVRTSDARSVAIDSSEAMRALLDLAVQKRGDALISQIQRLVGAPSGLTTTVVDPISAYEGELEACDQWFEKQDLTSPYWFMQILPQPAQAGRIPTRERLRNIVRDSEVALRGWNFPHTDRENDTAFEHGCQSVTHRAMHHEGYRVYRSGLFSWRQELREDRRGQYVDSVSYVSAMYTLMEFFVFAERYVTSINKIDHVVIRFGIDGLAGKRLYADARVNFWHDFTSTVERFEQSYELSIDQLRSSVRELAAQAAKELFELFDADVPIDTIKDWQTKFLNRQF